jgi:hypothetical protein
MSNRRKRLNEAPRPEELRTLTQLLEQLAEVNQRLARSHLMLTKIEPTFAGPNESGSRPEEASDPPLEGETKT